MQRSFLEQSFINFDILIIFTFDISLVSCCSVAQGQHFLYLNAMTVKSLPDDWDTEGAAADDDFEIVEVNRIGDEDIFGQNII